MTEACPGHWLVKASELRVCIVNGLIAFLTMQKTCFFLLGDLLEMQDLLVAHLLISSATRGSCDFP
jgi:hypothetical protein